MGAGEETAWGRMMRELAEFRLVVEGTPEGHQRAVIRVRGEIDMSNADQLQRSIVEASRAADGEVVVDLSRLEFLGSAGLSAVVMAQRSLRSRGGDVRLRKPNTMARKLLSVVGLDQMLEKGN